MKTTITVLFFFLFVTNTTEAQVKPKNGDWRGKLQLEKDVFLPFDFCVSNNALTIKNGEEKIFLITKSTTSDSIDYIFPDFDSFLRVKISNKKTITGFWYNRLKGSKYKIPFNGKLGSAEKGDSPHDITGNWETAFSIETNDPYPALGIFNQIKSTVSGTFLTETGDYRYLSGSVIGNNLTLSAFDGSHAFLFTANVSDTLSGIFYSGNHWKTNWCAFKNPDFKLRDADSITYLREETKGVSFTFPDLNGQEFTFPNSQYENKVVIIQLMGSWCPNCLDEAIFYKELLETYQSQGLEIITVCYEIPKSLEQKIEYVKRMAERNTLGFHFLIGGDAQKNQASTHFPMLNKIISFPTSLFLDKTGAVRRIHTGFSGPGTGNHFEIYKTKTYSLIEELLAE